MTIQDAFEWARHNHWHEPASVLDDKHTLADLDCDTVRRLLVSQRYLGELPDLSLFPHLNAFTSTKPVTTDYLAKQDLTVLKELNLYFEYGAGKIYLSLPTLEELTIAISNNDSDQLNMFACNDNSIHLENMPRLRRLIFRKCTGHKLYIEEIFPSIETVGFVNQDGTDYSILKRFPRLTNLTIAGCGCSDISFLAEYKTLKRLFLSYNYISNIQPLVKLPLLEYVDLRKNEITDASTLISDDCTVVISAEDASFEQFRGDVERSLITSYDFIERCRIPNPARPEWETRFFDRMSNDEIFVWKFKQEILNHIKRYSTENRGYPRTLIPAERLQAFISKEYPFVSL